MYLFETIIRSHFPQQLFNEGNGLQVAASEYMSSDVSTRKFADQQQMAEAALLLNDHWRNDTDNPKRAAFNEVEMDCLVHVCESQSVASKVTLGNLIKIVAPAKADLADGAAKEPQPPLLKKIFDAAAIPIAGPKEGEQLFPNMYAILEVTTDKNLITEKLFQLERCLAVLMVKAKHMLQDVQRTPKKNVGSESQGS